METLPLLLRCYDDIELCKGPIYQTAMMLICNSWRKENRKGKRKRDVSQTALGSDLG